MLEQFIPLFISKKFNICGDEIFDLVKGKSNTAADKIGEGKLYIDLLDEVPEDLICLN